MLKKRVPVSTIMTKNLVTANVTDDLRTVNSLLKTHGIHNLPIVSGEKLVGIVSKTDILRLSFGDIYEGQNNADEAIFDMLKLEQVMVSNPVCINADDTIKEAAEVLSNASFHALPVLENGKVAGIVTTTDVIKYLLTFYE